MNYYPGNCLEGLRKTMIKLSQYSQFLDQDMNLGPPEYEAGVLTTTFGIRNVILHLFIQ
jgi:hypothetical protein